jgi:hypothetical protein
MAVAEIFQHFAGSDGSAEARATTLDELSYAMEMVSLPRSAFQYSPPELAAVVSTGKHDVGAIFVDDTGNCRVTLQKIGFFLGRLVAFDSSGERAIVKEWIFEVRHRDTADKTNGKLLLYAMHASQGFVGHQGRRLSGALCLPIPKRYHPKMCR